MKNRILKSCAVLAVAGLVGMVATSVYAVCPDTLPLKHALGVKFTDCPEPVTAYAYSLPVPAAANAANTAGFQVVCEESGTSTDQSIACQGEAGTASDGNVTVQFDWGGIGGVVGCPASVPAPGVGRNVLRVIASDGSMVNLTVGYNSGSGYYRVDDAHPYTTAPLDLACSHQRGISLVSLSAGPSPSQHSVTVNVPDHPILSDCMPGTVGDAIGGCTEGWTSTRGKVYSLIGDCDPPPSPEIIANCTAGKVGDCTTVPGICIAGTVPPGTACVTDEDCAPCGSDSDCDTTVGAPGTCTCYAPGVCYCLPTDPCPSCACTVEGENYDECGVAGSNDGVCVGNWTYEGTPDSSGNLSFSVDDTAACAWVGATADLGGYETDMVGMLQIAGAAAASDRAIIRRAAVSQGKLNVNFETLAEINLVGFDVLANGELLNSDLIAAKGVGGAGASYSFQTKRAGLKDGDVIMVRSKLADGQTITSDPVALKIKKGKGPK